MAAPASTLELRLVLASLTETLALGHRLGRTAEAGDIICLRGELGTGKTTLTQAIGQGLEVPADQYITSPSFSLIHEYQGRLPLYHLDLYRLNGEDELWELGLEEYLYGQGVAVIEWPERLGRLTPAERLEVELGFEDHTGRWARIRAHGHRWRERLRALAGKSA